MNVQVEQVDPKEILRLIFSTEHTSLSDNDRLAMNKCMYSTALVWAGLIDEKLVCCWGLIAPTLLSKEAYLWLYDTEAVKEHQFVFVRHSQRVVQELLKRFPTIVGHCKVGADGSIRWIKWLGGKFGEPDGQLIPFWIGER